MKKDLTNGEIVLYCNQAEVKTMKDKLLTILVIIIVASVPVGWFLFGLFTIYYKGGFK